MHTKTCASAVKIYLFFLFISLFAVSGCGLDVEFGGNENEDVEENEIITGFIEEIIPDIGTDSTVVVKASVVKDETVFCCEDTTSVRDDFRIENNLDPKAELEFLENGNSSLGTIRIPVFPGATIDIADIIIEDRVPRYDYINISFEGQVDSKNCVNDTTPSGTMRVVILSEGNETEVTVNLTSRTDIERGDEEDLPCEEIVEGRKVKVDGKLGIGETVEADLVEIL
ncbi:MAG: hypothetical protein OXH82_05530 [Candidatus Dadabacteria bacterium]|nr:hypothetical protein [Candidatus Dadabacteria bacterium]MDE0663366.1 hypothetical protein [Candidatus Dadabacteria bacterium]